VVNAFHEPQQCESYANRLKLPTGSNAFFYHGLKLGVSEKLDALPRFARFFVKFLEVVQLAGAIFYQHIYPHHGTHHNDMAHEPHYADSGFDRLGLVRPDMLPEINLKSKKYYSGKAL
jgi:hypothetical protein